MSKTEWNNHFIYMEKLKTSYDLIFINQVLHVPKIQEIIISVSKRVADELLNSIKYIVKSNVSDDQLTKKKHVNISKCQLIKEIQKE